jgi:hypothetical protein
VSTETVAGDDGRPAPDDDDESTRAYLDQIQREIQDEVRRRRAAGDFPPSFERKLDELFARFTPTGTADDHFTEAIKLADRSAYFDINVPVGSRRTAKGAVRFALWQAEAWFVRYVVTQLNHFSSSAMRVLHLLDERVDDLERDVALLVPPARPEEAALSRGADPSPFAAAIRSRLESAAGPGRVLHAECGSGSLLAELGTGGIDAYGIDPGSEDSDTAARAGLDVRRDDVLGHLGSIRTEHLRGLVLSGCVDRMSLSERRRLVELAEVTLTPGGTVVVVGRTPASWERAAGPVAADLAPGRPLHPETWRHLLASVGFGDFDLHFGPSADSVGRVGPRKADAAVLNAALERIDELTGGPESFALLATKPAARR